MTRISVVRDDPGYSVDACYWAVLFNGEPAHFVQTADEDEGWIEYLSYPGGPCGVPEPRQDDARKLSMSVVDIDPKTRLPIKIKQYGAVRLVCAIPPETI